MFEDLLPYYQRELGALRQLAWRFAEAYPALARELQVERNACEDPHVERLLQGFAFLGARIHKKLDDDYPEITEALLGILYPHLVRPVPSMSVVEFVPSATCGLSAAQRIEAGREVLAPPVKGLRCQFRTAYPVDVRPLEISAAGFEPMERSDFGQRTGNDAAVIRIRLRTLGGVPLSALAPASLRFHIKAEPSTAHDLYELIFNSARRVVVRCAGGGAPVALPGSALRAVGFGPDEGLLDYDPRSLAAYRLLAEYFAFPEKFLFFDVAAPQALPWSGTECEIAIVLGPFQAAARARVLEQNVDAKTFRLHCTPVVNLFSQPALPIALSQECAEYLVEPNSRRSWGMEVYAIDQVRKSVRSQQGQEEVEYQPFYSLKHGLGQKSGTSFWLASRRPAKRPGAAGWDTYVSLVDLAMDPCVPAVESLSLQLTCTNGNLPAQLPFGGLEGDMAVEGAPFVARVQCLRKPTPARRPAVRKAAQWFLISHLSLNHLSLVEGGREALVEILALYNHADELAIRRMLSGVGRVVAVPAVARVGPPQRAAYVRGTDVEIELDEECFVGSGAYLFASVLERFLGLYCAANSFVRLRARTRQREAALACWPARAGDLELV